MRSFPIIFFSLLVCFQIDLLDSSSCFLTELCARYGSVECTKKDVSYNKSNTILNRTCIKWNIVNMGFMQNHNLCMNPNGFMSPYGPYCYEIGSTTKYTSRLCFDKCTAADTEECGNGGKITKTVIPETDRHKCTYLIGVAFNISNSHSYSLVNEKPEGCCQMCTNHSSSCKSYTNFLNGTCALINASPSHAHLPMYPSDSAISGELCDHANHFLPANVQQRQSFIEKSSKCSYLPGVVIDKSIGDDNFNKPTAQTPIGECCDLCLETEGCLGYTWDYGQKLCQLKSSLVKYRNIPGIPYHLSGEVCHKDPTNKSPKSSAMMTTIFTDGPSQGLPSTEVKLPAWAILVGGCSVGVIVLIILSTMLCMERRKLSRLSKLANNAFVDGMSFRIERPKENIAMKSSTGKSELDNIKTEDLFGSSKSSANSSIRVDGQGCVSSKTDSDNVM